MLLIYTILLILRPKGTPNRSPEVKTLQIDTVRSWRALFNATTFGLKVINI